MDSCYRGVPSRKANSIALNEQNNLIVGENADTSVMNTHSNKINEVAKVDIETSNFYSAVRTKQTVGTPYMYGKSPKFDTLPPKLEMDYSRILNKPYFIDNVSWPVGISSLATIPIPSAILLNKLASIPFDASVYYRAKISAILQTAGTPMHAGCAIASVVPAAMPVELGGTTEINTLLCCPHAFLNANESTPVKIEVPFYVQGKFAAIDLAGTTISPYSRNADYAELRIQVLSSLKPPTGGSNTLTVAVHFMFDDLEFYIPHVDPEWQLLAQGFVGELRESTSRTIDGLFSIAKNYTGDLLDTLRSGVRSWTGLHNPERPELSGREAVQMRQNLNLVDTPSFIEKMDPYGDFVNILDDYVFDTAVDEMSIAHLKTKPQFIGKFSVRSADTTGKLLWSRPITPIQEVRTVSYVNVPGDTVFTNEHSNIHQTLAYLSRYWKGSIKIHLQSVMTNFHYCKLILARDYSPDQNMALSYPKFESVTNLLTETVEFSSGGQIQTFVLPFCSPLNQLPCSRDFEQNAYQHGVYYIYLYQPLVLNGSVSSSIDFNVYITLEDDFDFFGYAVDPLVGWLSPVTQLPALREVPSDDVLVPQAAAFAEVSDQTPLMTKMTGNDSESIYDMRPIKSTRDYVRRYIKCQAGLVNTDVMDATRGLFQLPVSDIIGIAAREGFVDAVPVNKAFDLPSRNIISRMYLGFNGGSKFKIVINGATITEAWYVPPSYSILPTVAGAGDVWLGNRAVDEDGSDVNATIGQMFKFPERLSPTLAISTATEYSSQTVSVERPNYINVMPGYIMKSDDEVNINRIAHACTELEFEIPYMSPFRFVGDYTKFGYSDNDGVFKLATHDLGNIVLRIAYPENYTPGVASQKQAIAYEVFAANTDEARFGYQVNAPKILLPSYKVNNSYYQLASSIKPFTRKPPFSTMNGAPGFPLNQVTACYYASI